MDIENEAIDTLSKDRTLSKLIAHYGSLSIPNSKPDFVALVKIIISQQLSSVAAKTIFSRLHEKLGKKEISPSDLANLSSSEFRKAGISGGKTSYIKGISRLLLERPEFLDEINKMSDVDAMSALTQIKGIGEWSAGIFLLFDCGRKDIFPIGDASLNKAIKTLYKIDAKEAAQFAGRWSPYRSTVCLYLWEWIDSPI